MVTPVSLEYLLTRPLPEGVELVDYPTILHERIAQLQAAMEEWDASPDSPAYKILENQSFREFALRQLFNASILKSLLPYAEGATLDAWGVYTGIERPAGMTDELFRFKIANRSQANPITEGGLRNLVRSGPVDVVDVSLKWEITADLRQIKVWALKANQVELTRTELDNLLIWMDRPEHRVLGFENSLRTTLTKIPQTIALEVTFPAGLILREALEERVRASIYQWIDNNSKLGNNIYRNTLEQAALVPGVRTVTVTQPAADLSATTVEDDSPENTIYIFTKSTDGVAITMTAE